MTFLKSQKNFFFIFIIPAFTLFFIGIYAPSKPSISVILPTYNREALLPRAIDSILAQTEPDFELIVINDGSFDNTASILKEYAQKDNRIKVLTNKQNKGISYSLNKGLEAAKGTYIARMDDDDYAYPTRFEKQKKYLDKHTDITALGSAYKIEETGYVVQLEKDPAKNKIISFFKVPIFHPSAMIRRSFLTKNNIHYQSDFDSAEDTLFWYKISQKDGKISNIDDILMQQMIYSQRKEGYLEQQVTSYRLFIKKSLHSYLDTDYVHYPIGTQSTCYILQQFSKKNQETKEFDETALQELKNNYCQPAKKEIQIEHPNWKDFFIYETPTRLCRMRISSECAKITQQTPASITIKWDNWGSETFIKQNNGVYKEKSLIQ